METAVYIFDTKILEDKSIFDEQYSKMTEYRKNRIDSYEDENDRRLSLGTGIVLSWAIKEAGEDEKRLEYAKKESGMPYFKNKLDFCFSLSHSGERAMCAVSSKQIGCDVEPFVKDSDNDVLSWTKIESYAKATDTPLAFLMGKKGNFDSSFKFRSFEKDDGYIYTVCSKEDLSNIELKIIKIA